jgi:hypothetical protein
MQLPTYSESPFRTQLSFYMLIEELEKLASDTLAEGSDAARSLLQELAPYPELKTGIQDEDQIIQNKELISRLLANLFPKALTENEIKAVSIPYSEIVFNHTERFSKILEAAGPGFAFNIRNFDAHQVYVLSCCIILNEYYGTRLDFTKPLFYDIPTSDGVTRHYRILYNADFMEIEPTEKTIPLTAEDIDLLIDNYHNLDLWKEMFPPGSWLLKGFTIMNLYDATVENAVSILKEKLLGLNVENLHNSVETIFQSIYRSPRIRVGLSLYNREEGKLSLESFGQHVQSYVLNKHDSGDARELLCVSSYHNLVEQLHKFSVSNTAEFVSEHPESTLVRNLLSQGIQSFILAPVVKNKLLFGILELVSINPKELNSINANKLEVAMPFLTDSLERMLAEIQNQVEAVIQDKYTAVHRSVYWKFRNEAQKYIFALQAKQDYSPEEILFPDVYPLYGQIDIQGSSDTRNSSAQKDLQTQLSELIIILGNINSIQPGESYKEELLQLNNFLAGLSMSLLSGEEQTISNYLDLQVHPKLKQESAPTLASTLKKYFAATGKLYGAFHTHRRMYEKTITTINVKMAGIIDSRQPEAQAIFPHYYERFKTDGVEHNLYIGPSIAPTRQFDLDKLQELRIWQLRVLCEMETAHHQFKHSLPYPLEVRSLILVHYSTISIRFRMDEKRFDVDGSYNARFEILKKRIDKAHIKNTRQRITEAGKLAIVYSNEKEETEYLFYISMLQSENLLGKEIEKLEVEELQGVSGLKVLRVDFLHSSNLKVKS